jgi:uncharacterized protein YraI
MTMIAKSVFVAAGLLVLACGAATAAPALATRDLTVRAEPAGAAQVVGRIPGGSTVDARNCGQVWCRVTWRNVSGYVIRNYLDMDEGGPPAGYGAYGPPPPPVYGPPPPAYGPPPPLYPYGYYGPYWRPWYRW